MSVSLVLLLVAGAAAVGATAPAKRLVGTGRQPKAPRDGPGSPDLDSLEFADDVDLFAVCLESGLTLAAAAAAVGSAAGGSTAPHWRRVASLLGIGVPADRAFVDAEHLRGFDELARLVRLSTQSGSAIASGCRDLAGHLRSAAGDAAVARAERAGVLISLPLTGCFLPAFLVLGLAPVIISLGTDLLSG